MSAVTKLIFIFAAIVAAQCWAILFVKLMGMWGFLFTIPIGIICGTWVCWLINKE